MLFAYHVRGIRIDRLKSPYNAVIQVFSLNELMIAFD